MSDQRQPLLFVCLVLERTTREDTIFLKKRESFRSQSVVTTTLQFTDSNIHHLDPELRIHTNVISTRRR